MGYLRIKRAIDFICSLLALIILTPLFLILIIAIKLDSKDGSLDNFIAKEILSKPRQELESYYRINGALYLVRTKYLFLVESIYAEKCYALKMDKQHSIDIDDQFDFELADIILKKANVELS